MRRHGFTLIELLAVIVILAIILAIAVPGITGVINQATKNAFQSNAKTFIKAIQYKQMENDTFNPTLLNVNNMSSNLGISADNYDSISVGLTDGNLRVILIGKKTWNGLIACGQYTNMKVVSNTDDCGFTINNSPGIYTSSQIDNMVTSGYIPVANATELNNIRNSTPNVFGTGTKWQGTYTGGPDKKYVQVFDIQLSGWGAWTPIPSTGFFTGTYDGNGGRVWNLTGNSLFGNVTGTIRNLINEDANIVASNDVGGIAQYLSSTGRIEKCGVTGNLTSTDNYISGIATNGSGAGPAIIDQCYVRANLKANRGAGGMAAWPNSSFTVINSYFNGTIQGSEYDHSQMCTGGIFGYQYSGIVENSYAAGTAKGPRRVGGISGCGYVGKTTNTFALFTELVRTTGTDTSFYRRSPDSQYITVTNAYVNQDMIVPGGDKTGTPISLDAAKSSQVYKDAGWDFDNIWQEVPNDFPRLKWEGSYIPMSFAP